MGFRLIGLINAIVFPLLLTLCIYFESLVSMLKDGTFVSLFCLFFLLNNFFNINFNLFFLALNFWSDKCNIVWLKVVFVVIFF